MNENEFYNKVVGEVKNLVDYVLNECDDFADENDYDKEWVRDKFGEEFNKRKKL